MIAVIFEFTPAPGRFPDYMELVGQLKPQLDKAEGFISLERFESITAPGKYLSHAGRGVRDEIEMIGDKVARKVREERSKDSWHQVDTNFKLDGVYDGTVQNVADYGVFVDLAKGLAGLLHRSKLGSRGLGTFRKGESLRVRILAIDREAKQITLGLEG